MVSEIRIPRMILPHLRLQHPQVIEMIVSAQMTRCAPLLRPRPTWDAKAMQPEMRREASKTAEPQHTRWEAWPEYHGLKMRHTAGTQPEQANSYAQTLHDTWRVSITERRMAYAYTLAFRFRLEVREHDTKNEPKQE